MKVSKNKIGTRIRKERETLGLTIEGFAELIGKSSSYVGLLERGDRTPSIRTLFEIAASLNIPADRFLSDSESDTVDHSLSGPRRKLNIYIKNLSDSQIEQLVGLIKVAFFFKEP